MYDHQLISHGLWLIICIIKKRLQKLVLPAITNPDIRFFAAARQSTLTITAISAFLTAVSRLAKWENRDRYAEFTYRSALLTVAAWMATTAVTWATPRPRVYQATAMR